MSSRPIKDDLLLVPIDVIRKTLLRYIDDGYDSVWFLWWDISIHPNMLEIISYAKQIWFQKIQIITNAMIFEDTSKALDIINAWVDRVNISIHSHDPEVEDFLTQIPGWLQRKLRAIQNFNDLYNTKILSSPISINIVVNKQNFKNLKKTCYFFYKYNSISDIRCNFVWPEFSLEEYVDDILLSYTDFLPSFKEVVLLALKYNIRITFDTVPPCIFIKVFWYENWSKLLGRFLGEQFDFIDTIDVPWMWEKFQWKDRKAHELKYKSRSCIQCKYTNTCDGIWKDYVDRFGFMECIPVLDQTSSKINLHINRLGKR